MDQAPPVATLLKALRRDVRNWWVGPLAWFVLPSRLPPRAGLMSTRLGRREILLRMRSGLTIKCTVAEFEGVYTVYLLREYELPEVERERIQTIVDCGANAGAATLWFAGQASNARIIAIEPNPEVLPRLRANVVENGLAAKVTVCPVALGSTEGLTRISLDRPTMMATTTAVDALRSTEVRQTSLEMLMRDQGLDRIDLLKIDCEGSEYDVISDDAAPAFELVGAVVGEFHPRAGCHPRELMDRLRRWGFTVDANVRIPQGTFRAWRS